MYTRLVRIKPRVNHFLYVVIRWGICRLFVRGAPPADCPFRGPRGIAVRSLVAQVRARQGTLTLGQRAHIRRRQFTVADDACSRTTPNPLRALGRKEEGCERIVSLAGERDCVGVEGDDARRHRWCEPVHIVAPPRHCGASHVSRMRAPRGRSAPRGPRGRGHCAVWGI